jgi:hypothetical protein
MQIRSSALLLVPDYVISSILRGLLFRVEESVRRTINMQIQT